MRTIILRTASNYLLPILLLFSVFILLRGHYLPGGGFIGGLVAAIAFILYGFSHGIDKTRTLLKFHPGIIMTVGYTLAVGSALAPVLFRGLPIMTGLWSSAPVPVIGLVGSSLFFDTGVYLAVIGTSLTIILSIAENQR
ncbi:MAG: Na(+)/H(+) antiporter subunit B [Sphingobacteriales bacterium 41-5]|nr:MAG: Na(+)/H(+) antiporter subunit B [Sphingobacteriales bacterium 41-5]